MSGVNERQLLGGVGDTHLFSTVEADIEEVHLSEMDRSILDMQAVINGQRDEILKLQAQIETRKAIIQKAKKLIKVYKQSQSEQQGMPVRRGRRVRSRTREVIVTHYVKRWVKSLMETLGANGCGARKGLEYFLPSVLERQWRRWLNGDAVPPYKTIEELLGTKVAYGKYQGQYLSFVPAQFPSHNSLLRLLQCL